MFSKSSHWVLGTYLTQLLKIILFSSSSMPLFEDKSVPFNMIMIDLNRVWELYKYQYFLLDLYTGIKWKLTKLWNKF